jgi:3-hydroxybutyryl-CoA dehydrogenase
MTIAILADDVLKEEWLGKEASEEVELIWVDSLRSLVMTEADAYFDLLFDGDPERTLKLKQLKGKSVFINAVQWTGKVIGQPFIRINAWPTLLRRPVMEVALTNSSQEATVKNIFEALQWLYQLVPDTCGMVTSRVLAMIVNEAYFTFGEGVSSKEEIDIAMKLGTNYPKGPFEWSAAIGLKKIKELLKELSRTDARYTVSPALDKEVMG